VGANPREGKKVSVTDAGRKLKATHFLIPGQGRTIVDRTRQHRRERHKGMGKAHARTKPFAGSTRLDSGKTVKKRVRLEITSDRSRELKG